MVAGALARVAGRQRVERSGQSNQPFGLFQQRLERGGIGLDDAVAKRLQVALQVGKGRPKLMRGVGDELAPHPLLLLEGGRHLVERVRQADDLLGALARDPRSIVPCRDLAGRATDLAQRHRKARAEQAGNRHGNRDGDDDRADHDPADAVHEHLTARLGALAVLGHEVGEALRADDQDADDEDRDRDACDEERGERDLPGDAAASPDHGTGSALASVSVGASGAAR